MDEMHHVSQCWCWGEDRVGFILPPYSMLLQCQAGPLPVAQWGSESTGYSELSKASDVFIYPNSASN